MRCSWCNLDFLFNLLLNIHHGVVHWQSEVSDVMQWATLSLILYITKIGQSDGRAIRWLSDGCQMAEQGSLLLAIRSSDVMRQGINFLLIPPLDISNQIKKATILTLTWTLCLNLFNKPLFSKDLVSERGQGVRQQCDQHDSSLLFALLESVLSGWSFEFEMKARVGVPKLVFQRVS